MVEASSNPAATTLLKANFKLRDGLDIKIESTKQTLDFTGKVVEEVKKQVDVDADVTDSDEENSHADDIVETYEEPFTEEI
jgi:hypothetical protein